MPRHQLWDNIVKDEESKGRVLAGYLPGPASEIDIPVIRKTMIKP
jgi:hypothetical protein